MMGEHPADLVDLVVACILDVDPSIIEDPVGTADEWRGEAYAILDAVRAWDAEHPGDEVVTATIDPEAFVYFGRTPPTTTPAPPDPGVPEGRPRSEATRAAVASEPPESTPSATPPILTALRGAQRFDLEGPSGHTFGPRVWAHTWSSTTPGGMSVLVEHWYTIRCPWCPPEVAG